jgi:hypothetical protein
METAAPEALAPSAAATYQHNFLLFATLFSIVHATVDGVLAFSAAELGKSVGSYGGFMLYVVYTLTALMVARPFLLKYSAKTGVLVGLIGMLCYVCSFFLAVLFERAKMGIFLVGAAMGGAGAGILWPSQGIYFSETANLLALAQVRSQHVEDDGNLNIHATMTESQHAMMVHAPLQDDGCYDLRQQRTVQESSDEENHLLEASTSSLSGIFASLYLGLESVFKMLATGVYLYFAFRRGDHDENGYGSWRSIAFGVYSVAAFGATALFAWKGSEVDKFNDYRAVNSTERMACDHHAFDDNDKPGNIISSPTAIFDKNGALSVIRLLYNSRPLQLLMPYQICFGMSAGFVDAYINRVIVAKYIGDGYIGALTAVTTLSAALVVMPLAMLANSYQTNNSGKAYIMLGGGICFLIGPLLVLALPEDAMGNWTFLVFFFIIHGIARGVWESTNKAIFVDFFGGRRRPSVVKDDPVLRDQLPGAFASIYFASGIAGAIGFLVNQFLSKLWISLANVLVAVIAIICFWKCMQMKRN